MTRVTRKPLLTLLACILASCSPTELAPSDAPEAPAVAPTPPQPLPTTLVERSVQGVPIQVHIATPEDGRSIATQAAEQALDEFERVLQLGSHPEEPAELAQLSRTAQAVWEKLAPGSPDLRAASPLLRAYAVDRCAASLAELGVTDFLVSAGLTLSARGSKDGSHRGGWRVGLPPADPAGQPEGVILLLNQAMHGSTASGRRASAVSPSALLAAAGAEGWTQWGGAAEPITHAAEQSRLALRIVDEDGQPHSNTSFEALLQSQSFSLDRTR